MKMMRKIRKSKPPAPPIEQLSFYPELNTMVCPYCMYSLWLLDGGHPFTQCPNCGQHILIKEVKK